MVRMWARVHCPERSACHLMIPLPPYWTTPHEISEISCLTQFHFRDAHLTKRKWAHNAKNEFFGSSLLLLKLSYFSSNLVSVRPYRSAIVVLVQEDSISDGTRKSPRGHLVFSSRCHCREWRKGWEERMRFANTNEPARFSTTYGASGRTKRISFYEIIRLVPELTKYVGLQTQSTFSKTFTDDLFNSPVSLEWVKKKTNQ